MGLLTCFLVILSEMLRRFFMMLFGLQVMAVRDMCVMRGFSRFALFVMLGCKLVMFCGMLEVFRCVVMMLSGRIVVRHGIAP
jgi:hypothetical protein